MKSHSGVYVCTSCGMEGDINVEFKAEARKKKIDVSKMVCDECRQDSFQRGK